MGFAFALAAIGTAVSTYAAYRQGEIGEQTNRYNAKLAQRDAEQKRNLAAAAAEDTRERHERTLAAQRARYAASGVSIDEGSPLLVMLQSEEEAALDIARIQAGGREAAEALDLESRIYKWNARRARQQGYLNTGAALLNGTSSAYGSYARTSKKSGGGIGYGAASTPPPGNYPY